MTRRQGVIQSLQTRLEDLPPSVASSGHKNRFDELAANLDEALGGLADKNGRPTPAMEAVLGADKPEAVIEYLADEDNADEAERFARMNDFQRGKYLAKLEAKLETQPKKAAPKASKAPAPLEPIRGQGSTSGAPDPSDTKAWIRWRNEQERKGL